MGLEDYDRTLEAAEGFDPREAELVAEVEWHRQEVEDAQVWLAEEERNVVEARAALARRTAEYERAQFRLAVRS